MFQNWIVVMVWWWNGLKITELQASTSQCMVRKVCSGTRTLVPCYWSREMAGFQKTIWRLPKQSHTYVWPRQLTARFSPKENDSECLNKTTSTHAQQLCASGAKLEITERPPTAERWTSCGPSTCRPAQPQEGWTTDTTTRMRSNHDFEEKKPQWVQMAGFCL